MQERRPVSFASRAFSKSESNYAQIEKELLAIAFACEQFDQYICQDHNRGVRPQATRSNFSEEHGRYLETPSEGDFAFTKMSCRSSTKKGVKCTWQT